MHILAHRANLSGARAAQEENHVIDCQHAFEYGFGVETDIRVADGRGLLSHDSQPYHPQRDLLAALQTMETFYHKGNTAPQALNVKDEAGVLLLLEALPHFPCVRDHCFLFDFELAFTAEQADQLMRLCRKSVAVAPRLSERESSLAACLAAGYSDIWLDEWEQDWIDDKIVRQLQAARIRVHVVSPDLHTQHGRAVDWQHLRCRWNAFAKMGVDSICTDYPLLLKETL
jgi:hypothetical protein